MSADELLKRAIQAHQTGQLAIAEALYRDALRLRPKDPIGLLHIGIIALQTGRPTEAVPQIRRALKVKPDFPEAHNNLGLALLQTGEPRKAAESCRQALRLRPAFAEAHNNLAGALKALGRRDEAISAYRQALALKPAYPDALNGLGIALQEAGEPAEAETCFRNALALRPNQPKAHNNLGVVLQRLGRLDAAIDSFQQALALAPAYPEALNNLGTAFKALGRRSEALATIRRALDLEPAYAEAHNNYGVALQELGRFGEAAEAYRQALALSPSYAEAWSNLGNCLKEMAAPEEAAAAFERAAALQPDDPGAAASLFHLRQHLCDWRDFDAMAARIVALGAAGSGKVSPFLMVALPSSAAEQRACATAWAANYAVPEPLPPRQPRKEGGRIRLGYLSADFHSHATAFLMAELFERHDRAAFEIFGYSCGPEDDGPMRRRLVAAFDHFIDLRLLPHAEAARRIRDDSIDILIDLKGYTAQSRPQILAWRPAPVQINYLGYPGTMGAPFIDYLLADPFVVPADQAPHYSETVLRLPGSYQPNDTRRAIAGTTPSRGDCGLPPEGFVFCCFNDSYKITPTVFDIWMRLLAAVPGSVLWLLDTGATARANLRHEAELRGVPPDRLVFAPKLPLPEHLARHRLADLFLDTLPCNAHTTASDALWAGLPLLTCAGDTFAGRVAGSLLHAVGLPELVTTSLDDYEQTALRLAQNPAELAAIAQKLRENRDHAALFDIAEFTRQIEHLYRQIAPRAEP